MTTTEQDLLPQLLTSPQQSDDLKKQLTFHLNNSTIADTDKTRIWNAIGDDSLDSDAFVRHLNATPGLDDTHKQLLWDLRFGKGPQVAGRIESAGATLAGAWANRTLGTANTGPLDDLRPNSVTAPLTQRTLTPPPTGASGSWDTAPPSPPTQQPAQYTSGRLTGLPKPQEQTYQTQLTPAERNEFTQWVVDNHIPFNAADPHPDYDMPGFWKAMKSGDPTAVQASETGHFPDTWKTPYHESFSNESKYAGKDAPRWNDQNQLVDLQGKILFSDRYGKPAGAADTEPSVLDVAKQLPGKIWTGIKEEAANAVAAVTGTSPLYHPLDAAVQALHGQPVIPQKPEVTGSPGSVAATIVKEAGGVAKGASLQYYDPEKGTLQIPITGDKIQLHRGLSDVLENDWGAPSDIARDGTAESIGNFFGSVAPWSAISRALSYGLAVASASTLAKAAQAGVPEKVAQAVNSMSSAILKRAGFQGAVGAIYGAVEAPPTGETEDQRTVRIGQTALMGAGFSMIADSLLALFSGGVTPAVRSEAVGKLKANLSDLFYRGGQFTTPADAAEAADHIGRQIVNDWAEQLPSKQVSAILKDWETARTDATEDLLKPTPPTPDVPPTPETPPTAGPGGQPSPEDVPSTPVDTPPTEGGGGAAPSPEAGTGKPTVTEYAPEPTAENSGVLDDIVKDAETKPVLDEIIQESEKPGKPPAVDVANLPAGVTYTGPTGGTNGEPLFHVFTLESNGKRVTLVVKDGESIADAAAKKLQEISDAAAKKTPPAVTPSSPAAPSFTVREREDGKFEILNPRGNLVPLTPRDTREEAEKIAAQKNKNLPTPPPGAPAVLPPPAEVAPPAVEPVQKPAWQMTRKEFVDWATKNPDKLDIPADYNVDVLNMDDDELESMPKAHLSALAKIHGVPSSGNKDSIIGNLKEAAQLADDLDGETVDSLQQKTSSLLKQMAKEAGIYVGGNKYAISSSLVAWAKAYHRGKFVRIVEDIHRTQINQASASGEAIPQEVRDSHLPPQPYVHQERTYLQRIKFGSEVLFNAQLKNATDPEFAKSMLETVAKDFGFADFKAMHAKVGDLPEFLGSIEAATWLRDKIPPPPALTLPPPNVEPELEAPTVPAGYARFYHGGSTPGGGARWVTPDYNYAKGYADKSGSKVYSVDIPKTSELLHKSYDDTGADHPAPYVSFEAPGGLTWRLAKAPEPSVVKPPAVITAPPEASKPEWDEWIAPYTTDDGKDREVSGEIYNGHSVYKAPVGRYKGEWVVGNNTGLIAAGPFPTKKDAKAFVETPPSAIAKPPAPPIDLVDIAKQALAEPTDEEKLKAQADRLAARHKAKEAPKTGINPRAIDDAISMMEINRDGEKRAAAGMDPRIMRVLGGNLYSGDLTKIAIKESIQNAVDSLREAATQDEKTARPSSFPGKINIVVDSGNRKITIKDNGVGMLPAVALKELVDIGGTKKGEDASGGFGLAKVAIFANSENIDIRTVARGNASDLVGIETRLTGSGEDWLNPNVGLKVDQRDTYNASGTTMTLQLAKPVDPWSLQSYLMDFIAKQRTPFEITATIDAMDPITKDNVEIQPVQPIATLNIPGATIALYVSDETKVDYGITVDIQNRGLPQFQMGVYMPSKLNVPVSMIADVRSTSTPEHEDYPFRPDREGLRGAAKSAIEEWIKNNLQAAAEAKEQVFFNFAWDESPIVTRVDGQNLRIVDTTGELPANLVKSIADSLEMAKLSEFFAEAFVAAQDKLAPIDQAFAGVEFHGIGLSGKYLGLNVKGSAFTNSDETSNRVLLNPFVILEEALLLYGRGRIANVAAVLSQQVMATIVHELVHQQDRGHEVAFAGYLTRSQGHTASLVVDWARQLQHLLEEDNNAILDAATAFLEELAPIWSRTNIFNKVSADSSREGQHPGDQGDLVAGQERGTGPGADLSSSSGSASGSLANSAGPEASDVDLSELSEEDQQDIISIGAQQFKLTPLWPAWEAAMLVRIGDDWVKPYLPTAFDLIDSVAFATGAVDASASEQPGDRRPEGTSGTPAGVDTPEGVRQPAEDGTAPVAGRGSDPTVGAGVPAIEGLGTESGSGGGTGTGASPTGAGSGRPGLTPPSTTGKNAGFYRIDPTLNIGVGTEGDKIKDNIKALQVLKSLREGGRLPTDAERNALARYVGWGGLSGAFRQGRYSTNDVYQVLKDLLTPEEYEAARRSTVNAHYTSPLISRFLWDIATRLGFKKGTVLEPSMGIGNIIGLAPDAVVKRADFIGVELDNVTAEIAKYLYPGANIYQRGFQEVMLPDGSITLAIGNVPFGDFGVHDTRYNKLKLRIHDYFFIKSLDKVEANGAVIFITSRYTMDKQNSKIRELIADRADLVAAFRLPNDSFQENARTEVTTDILILRKRAPGEVRSTLLGTAAGAASAFRDLKPLTPTMSINEYFVEHPENMLGRMAETGTMYGSQEPTLESTGPLAPQLEKALKRITGKLFSGLTRPPGPEIDVVNRMAPDDVKEKAYIVDDEGSIKQRINGLLVDPPKEIRFGDGAKQVKAMIRLRDQVKELIRIQMDSEGDEPLRPAQTNLGILYDAYVKKYGHLQSLKTSGIFKEDPQYPLLLSLERFDPATSTVAKADIFTHRTITPYRPLSSVSPDPKEGLLQVLAERGYPDLQRLAALAERPIEQTITELEDLDLVYRNPDTGAYEMADAYLSGAVKDKLAKARFAASADQSYQRNVDALVKVQPVPLTIEEIIPKLGATWIPPQVIDSFLDEITGVYESGQTAYFQGKWTVKANSRAERSVGNTREYGGGGIGAIDLTEFSLNQKRPKVIIKHDDGSTSVDEARTLAAREAQKKIKAKFERWVRETPRYSTQLQEIYNERFNSIRNRVFDGSHLVLPGSNASIHLRRHQLDAIWRIVNNTNGLLAHVVGAGKTFEMIASGMELKRLGIKKKIMYTVPNNLITSGQWAEDFYKLYPGANVLVATKEDFQEQNRKQLMSRIATGNWDAILVGHSSFDMLPVSPEREAKTIQQALEELDEALAGLQPAGTSGRQSKSRSVKQLEKAKLSLEAELKKLMDKPHDDTIYFDQLGVDALFVDEAHKYKNLTFYTKMGTISGLGQGDSKRAIWLKAKTDFLHEIYGGGVVLATGTPISNTIAETYALFKYVAPTVLPNAGIKYFDDWAANFGEVVDVMDLTVDAKSYKSRPKFSEFTNLPELISMFRGFADIKQAEDLNLPVPMLRGGKPLVIAAPATPDFEEVMVRILQRAEALRSGVKDKKIDNWLKLTSDGKKVALDVRLYDATLEDHPDSKANMAVDAIYNRYQQSHEVKGTQLVFADQFQNTKEVVRDDVMIIQDSALEKKRKKALKKKVLFNLYEDMKAKLIKRGVPEDEIAIIQDVSTDEERTALFKAFNAGTIRIMLGSTSKMGEGTNLQERLIALHHLDAPWTPKDLQQREGRIIRQGNKNAEVEIIQYVTSKSFDAYIFQALETKARSISRIMSGTMKDRRTSDSASAVVMNYAETKAIASDNPDVKRKMELEMDLNRLDLLERNFRYEQVSTQSALARAHRQIGESETRLQVYRHFNTLWQSSALLDGFSAEIDGQYFPDRESTVKYLEANPGVRPEYDINGIVVKVTTSQGGTGKSAWITHQMEIAPVDGLYGMMPESPAGIVASVESRMGKMPIYIHNEEADIARNRKAIVDLEHLLENRVFEHTDEIRVKTAELAEIDTRLAWKEPVEEVEVDDNGPDPDGPKTEDMESGDMVALGSDEYRDPDEAVPVTRYASVSGNVAYDSAPGRAPFRKEETPVHPMRRSEMLPPPTEYAVVALNEIQDGAAIALANVIEMTDQIAQIAVPAKRGPIAQTTALVIRQGAARLAANMTLANEALYEARRYFDRQPVTAQRNFMFAVEDPDGPWQLDDAEQKFAAIVRKWLDETWEQILERREGLETYITNYFPHLWKDPKKAADLIQRGMYGRRPLEGRKAFLKKRSIATIFQGIELGLEPLFDNPIEAVLAQLHQENKFITGADTVEELQELGILQFGFAESSPGTGMERINDPIGTVYGPPTLAVKEAYDEHLFSRLNKFARTLGIKHYRMAAEKGMSGHTWGWASTDGVIHTRFAGPETVLTHEIGHQLDFHYGLAKMMVRDPAYAKELRSLADMRFEGNENVSDSYQREVRKGSEKIANLIHAMIHAPEMAEQLAPKSVQAIRDLVAKNPNLKPLLEIRSSLVLGERTQELAINGVVIKGHWWAPEPAALLLNNYLSPGLAGFKPYDAFRYMGNFMNQMQLGISGYHYLFTGLEAMISKMSVGVRQVFQGKVVQGLGNIGAGTNVVSATWLSMLEGDKILKEFYRPGSQGTYYARVIDDLIKAGGRVKMDSMYMNSSVESFWKSWRTHKSFGMMGHAIPAMMEQIAKPMMQEWVPRLKLAVFAEQSRVQLDALGPNASPMMVRYTLSQVWDSVDNRMGQMVYDNLFWNRMLKDLGMAAVRSLGWNIGSLRLIIGGIADWVRAAGMSGPAWVNVEDPDFLDIGLLKPPPSDGGGDGGGGSGSGRIGPASLYKSTAKKRFVMTPGMGYVIFATMMLGLIGAMYQYLMTGRRPGETEDGEGGITDILTDLYYPQNGGVNKDGTPSRSGLPSYAKDVYAFSTHPIDTLKHKGHPLTSMVLEMLDNRDYYGVEIAHPDDPYVYGLPLRQLRDYMEFVAGQFVPFALKNVQYQLEHGAGPRGAIGAFFTSPAPQSLTDSKAMRLGRIYQEDSLPSGSRTKEAAARSKMKSDFVEQLREAARTGNDIWKSTAKVENSITLEGPGKAGVLSADDINDIHRAVSMTSLQRVFDHATLENTLNAWDVATPAEKIQLRPLLYRKEPTMFNLPADELAAMQARFEKFAKEDMKAHPELTAPPH